MHGNQCNLHYSLLNRALSRWRQFHVLWRHIFVEGLGPVEGEDKSAVVWQGLHE